MKRRYFLSFLGGAIILQLAACDNPPKAIPLIGVLVLSTKDNYRGSLNLFLEKMRELGYEDEKGIRYEFRYADNDPGRLPRLAQELVELNPNVIFAWPLQAIQAAKHATTTIPIVMGNTADPVGFGLVNSLSHPGGNITGTANYAEILPGKQFEILRELRPVLNHVAMLVNLSNPLHVPQVREIQAATSVAGTKLLLAEIKVPAELSVALKAISQANVDGFIVPPDVVFLDLRREIIEFSASARIPAVYANRSEFLEGGLIVYGPNYSELYRVAATYVDKILKGKKPSELPVWQPTNFVCLVNLKTARAMGIAVPPELLARATEVIE